MRIGALVLLAVLAACGPKQHRVARDAPVPWEASGIDWTRPPALAAPQPFAPPALDEATLPNGVRVIVAANHRLPLVALAVVIDGAGSREDRGAPGIAALTAELLAEGAGQRSAAAMRRELELVGAHVDTRIATDTASVHVVAPSSALLLLAPLLGDVIRRPRFDDADVERVRARRLAELAQRRQRPRTVAAQIFDRVAFGAHPYALPAEGSSSAVAAIGAAELRAFWQRTYAPGAVTLIAAGDVSIADARRLADAALGDWQHTASPSPAPPLAPFAPQLAIVDAPDAAQSVVLIGRPAPAAGDPHQLAGDVANTIVGGGIGARLDRALHEQLALTLGASASFWRGRWAGSWAAATTFATDQTLTGIRAALDVIARATTLTADELARGKRDLLAAAQQAFETSAGTVRALERAVAQGLPRDWYAAYAERLDALALADVQAAARWSDLAVVIVGDRAKLSAQLGELGLPIVQYDRDGTRQP